MTNPYYNGGAFPATGAPATSASMRAELGSISSGFDKLPTLSGNATKLVAVNSSGTALEAVSVLPPLTITDSNLVVEDNADSTRKFRFEASGITAGATRVLTVPDANMTIVGLDVSQTLTNKTINLANNTLIATSAQLAAAVGDETGSGALVFGTSPTIATPTLSGSVTISGGTANGVTYLNASKVLTSGSALTFDGTNFTTTGYAAGNGLRSLGGNAVRFYNATNANWSQISAPAGTGDMQFDTGAGEQMRLTSTGLGIGTSSPSYRLQVVNSGSNSTVAVGSTNAGETGRMLLFASSSKTTWMLGAQQNIDNGFEITPSTSAGGTTFSTPGLVVLNSGNVGIGVTPSYKLQVAAASVSGTVDRAVVVANTSASGAGSGSEIWIGWNSPSSFAGAGVTIGGVFPGAGSAMTFSTAASNSSAPAERMRLDSSGNLGLGVTPSAWWSAIKPLQMSGNGFVGSASNFTYLGANFFYNSSANPVYVASAAASLYEQGAGGHRWFTAPSGTAGNAISFTQAMTLDASGQWLLGGTSLDNPQSWGRIAQVINSGTNGAAISVKDANNEFNIATYNSALIIADGVTERMRLDSSGNLGIGTNNPLSKLHTVSTDGSQSAILSAASGLLRVFGYADATRGALVESTNIAQSTWLPLTLGGSVTYLQTGGTTRATLDSSGNLGLGVTPQPWSTPAFEVIGGLAISSVSGADYTLNAYYNAGWLYRSNGTATRYEQNTGQHRWYTAPSGTAGNTISFTQAMTLDASGNLALGTTSPSTKLHVSASTAVDIRTRTGNSLQALDVGVDVSGNALVAGSGAYPLIFYTNSSERARITSGGDFLVGATANPGVFNRSVVIDSGANTLAGVVFQNDTTGRGSTDGSHIGISSSDFVIVNLENAPIRLRTNNVERMVVKSSGQVRFVPLASAPGGAEAGDVYYDSGTNKLRCYNGTTWNDLF